MLGWGVRRGHLQGHKARVRLAGTLGYAEEDQKEGKSESGE